MAFDPRDVESVGHVLETLLVCLEDLLGLAVSEENDI